MIRYKKYQSKCEGITKACGTRARRQWRQLTSTAWPSAWRRTTRPARRAAYAACSPLHQGAALRGLPTSGASTAKEFTRDNIKQFTLNARATGQLRPRTLEGEIKVADTQKHGTHKTGQDTEP